MYFPLCFRSAFRTTFPLLLDSTDHRQLGHSNKLSDLILQLLSKLCVLLYSFLRTQSASSSRRPPEAPVLLLLLLRLDVLPSAPKTSWLIWSILVDFGRLGGRLDQSGGLHACMPAKSSAPDQPGLNHRSRTEEAERRGFPQDLSTLSRSFLFASASPFF